MTAWRELVKQGFYMAGNPHSSFFYIFTGLHAAHLIGGLVAVFILLANLLSVFPTMSAPTAAVTVPLGCAIVTFLYFNWQGIRHHGAGHYLLTFAGSPKTIGDWALAVLLFPVELISTSARLLSLTVRLWANIFAGDLITLVFFSMIPIGIPIIFSGLHIVVAVLQAYVFMLLSIIYVSGAVAVTWSPLAAPS